MNSALLTPSGHPSSVEYGSSLLLLHKVSARNAPGQRYLGAWSVPLTHTQCEHDDIHGTLCNWNCT